MESSIIELFNTMYFMDVEYIANAFREEGIFVPPTPIRFDSNNKLHQEFVISCKALCAIPKPAIYEKDNPEHLRFLTVASNLYAQCYSHYLTAMDQNYVRRISGNIVPALATVTGVVAGLVMMETLKVLLDIPTHQMWNYNFDLSKSTLDFRDRPVDSLDVGINNLTVVCSIIINSFKLQ